MTKVIRIIGAIGCWACIIVAAIFISWKAAALVAMAIMLEAIVAATLIVDDERERINEIEAMLRDLEDDGK